MLSIDNQMLSRIYGLKRGAVFTPTDFLDLGSRQAVGLALFRLVRRGTIRRLAWGVYDYPKLHSRIGMLYPGPDTVAKALARSAASRLQPSGAYATNLLRLSEQVPARVVYLTDGQGRKVKLGNLTIELKRTTPRNMATAGRTSGLVIQAFRHLGRKHVDAARLKQLKGLLSEQDKKQLLKDVVHAPAWMQPLFREMASAGRRK